MRFPVPEAFRRSETAPAVTVVAPTGLSRQKADEIARNQPRNFVATAAYQIVMRIGWIFKTESIIMPAVLDTLGGGAWLRGCLPLLNRFGHSIPPMLLSRRVTLLPQKKYAVALCSLVMSATMLLLAGTFYFAPATWMAWMPGMFLLLYTLFFVATGVNQLSLGTMQGKLIEPALRGRLFTAASTVGAVFAVTAAWFLLEGWLAQGQERFDLIFGFAGVCFALSIAAILLIREPPDDYQHPPVSPLGHVVASWGVLRNDRNFRRLSQVAMLFGTSIMLFPHYQALARQRLDLPLANMAFWVIVQNLGTAAISILAGPVADRRGNRLVLWGLLTGLTMMPVLAIVLAHTGALGRTCYPLVFLLVGMTPITIKTLQNYTLEICEPVHHARYLSTLALCVAGPILLSPLVGWLVDLTSFELVFSVVACLLLLGLLRSLGLQEPRHHVTTPPETAGLTGEE